MIGARGGVGASTVALNCAWLMAHEQNLQTALLDLDLYFGTSALLLDLLPGRGLREALENPDRIDPLFVAGVMVNASDRLFILAGEEPLEEDLQYDPAALDQLTSELRRTYSRVVIDLPRSMTLPHRYILTASSQVVIVTDQTLPAVRDTVRLRKLVRERAPRARILVVANNVGAKTQVAFSKAEFERGIEARLDHLIPHDRNVVRAALHAGNTVPQQAKGSKLTAALRGLAIDITAMQPVKQRGGFLRRRRSIRR
ncbi:MAG: CpaE family protein [Kiloniellales bacterium]